MKLKKLLCASQIPVPYWSEELINQDISAITHNSNEVKPGSLFVALCGFTTDGHTYLREASNKGAAVAFVERKCPVSIPQIVVPDTRKALAYIANAFYGSPAKKMSLIGVTGTNGKTTTTQLVHHILGQTRKSGLIGTIDVRYGSKIEPSSLTTPDVILLHEILQRMLSANVSCVSMEVSSHALELHRVTGLLFDHVAITNISTDHLDLHHSLANYTQTKLSLLNQLNPLGNGFYNIDDAILRRHLYGAKNTLSYGKHPKADLRIMCFSHSLFQITFSLHAQRLLKKNLQPSTIQLQMFGEHNIYNAVLATGLCLAHGCDVQTIVQGLESFQGVHRRLQVIHNQSFKVIDDYAHNPAGIAASIQAVSTINPKRLIVVCAIRGTRGCTINQENGTSLLESLGSVNFPVHLIITAATDSVNAKDRVSSDERLAFVSVFNDSPFPVYEEPLLCEALNRALRLAGEGDIMLLLGAQGMDRAQEIIRHSLMVGV